MARRTKRTKATRERILKALRLGATYELAARYGGIHYDTLNEWRKDDPEFSEAIEKAEGDAATSWLERIETAANEGNWQAAAWKLERRYPESYGRREVTKHEHSGPNGGAIQFSFGAVIAELASGSAADREDVSER